jgi:hypothetical protein
VNIESHLPPITTAELDEFERATGMELVPAYRDFLLTHNGGRPENNLIDLPGLDDTTGVNDFYGLQPGDDYDLRRELEVYDGRIPPGALPIAEDPGGNLFLLSLANGSKGAVFFWDHEEEPPHAADWSDFPNVYRIAGSFEDFLSSIRPDDA